MTTRKQQHAVILAVVALALTAVATSAGLLVGGSTVLWGAPAAAAAAPGGATGDAATGPSATATSTDGSAIDTDGDAAAVAGSSMVGAGTPSDGTSEAVPPPLPATGAWVSGRDWANGTYATHCGSNLYAPAQKVALRAGRHSFGDAGLPDTVLRLREKVSVDLGDRGRYLAVVLDCVPGGGSTTSQVFLFRTDGDTPQLLGEAVSDTDRLAVDAVSQDEFGEAVVVTGSGWSPGTPDCCPDETRLYTLTPHEDGLRRAEPTILTDRAL